MEVASNLTVDEAAGIIGDEFKKILKVNSVKQEKVLGMGISIPGLIENNNSRMM